MISVTLIDADTFEVVVDGTSRTRHRARLSSDCHRQLCGGEFSYEWVVVQAVRFLLERQANTDLPVEFDLAEIGRSHPGFESDIARRLGISSK